MPLSFFLIMKSLAEHNLTLNRINPQEVSSCLWFVKQSIGSWRGIVGHKRHHCPQYSLFLSVSLVMLSYKLDLLQENTFIRRDSLQYWQDCTPFFVRLFSNENKCSGSLVGKKDLKQYGRSPHLLIFQKEIIRMLGEMQNYVSVMPCCLCMP